MVCKQLYLLPVQFDVINVTAAKVQQNDLMHTYSNVEHLFQNMLHAVKCK